MTTSDLSSRLDDFARRLAGLEQELRELRELAHAEGPPHRGANLDGAGPAASAAATSSCTQAPPAKPMGPAWNERLMSASRFDRDVSLDDLLGLKALAWAGGP